MKRSVQGLDPIINGRTASNTAFLLNQCSRACNFSINKLAKKFDQYYSYDSTNP